MTSPSHLKSLRENDLNEYLDFFELSGITFKHKKETKRAITKYLEYVKWDIDKHKSLAYFKMLQKRCSTAYYKKQMYQIMKFLKHLGHDWVNDIKLPPDPFYTPKRVTSDDIQNTLEYLRKKEYYKRNKAIVLLGYASGLRAEELFKLTPDDIDIATRTIHIKHDPKNNHSTKTKKSRISFFTNQAREAVQEYILEFEKNDSETMFPQRTLERIFKNAPIRVKDLRKGFSQEWTRRQGDTGVKKILMGHSLRNDIDLMHYNAQSEDDLKRIYDRVMK